MKIKLYKIVVPVAPVFICLLLLTSCGNVTNQRLVTDQDLQSSQAEMQETEGLLNDNNEVKQEKDSSNRIVLADMVFIPEGEFLMGNGDSMEDHSGHGHHDHHEHKHKDVDFGKQAHNVYLDSYYIDKYEVTNAKYNKFIEAGGYDNSEYWSDEGWEWLVENKISEPFWWRSEKGEIYKSGIEYPDYPVTGISWYEASAYSKWIGKSLPTEAQWEKAARGDTNDKTYPWGNEMPDCSFANYCGEKYKFCVGSTSIVGSYDKGKSQYGAYDMTGNVWEWCKDWYGVDYYKISPYKNPQGPLTGERRALRGGSWVNEEPFISSTFRQKLNPGLRDYFNGFRCVVELKKGLRN